MSQVLYKTAFQLTQKASVQTINKKKGRGISKDEYLEKKVAYKTAVLGLLVGQESRVNMNPKLPSEGTLSGARPPAARLPEGNSESNITASLR